MSFVVDLDDFHPDGAVFIYGSDVSGRALRRALAARGVETSAFLDSFQSGEADGLIVLRFDHYLQVRDPTDIVLIASAAEAEISKSLEAHGIDRYFGAVQVEV
jgi:hypothetical protein